MQSMDNSMVWETNGQDNEPPAVAGRLPDRSVQGDCPDLDQIVSLYRTRIARLAYRLLGWDAEAEDVVQDVFVSVLKNLKNFRGRSSLWTWLARITVNRCHNLRRRREVRKRLLPWVGRRLAHADRDTAERAEDRETFEQVRQAALSLPAKLRDVTVLRYLEEMSIDEVAEVLGASANTVRVRLHRARELLRRKLASLMERA